MSKELVEIMKAKDELIASLEEKIQRTREQLAEAEDAIEELQDYKIHFEIEMRLRHGER